MTIIFENKKVNLLLNGKKASQKVYTIEVPTNMNLITAQDEKLIDSNDLELVIRKKGF